MAKKGKKFPATQASGSAAFLFLYHCQLSILDGCSDKANYLKILFGYFILFSDIDPNISLIKPKNKVINLYLKVSRSP